MKKYIPHLIALLALSTFLFILASYFLVSPPFIESKLKELRSDRNLMDSIGGYYTYEYTFNENDYEQRDTLTFSILITGSKKTLLFKGVEIKNPNSEWVLADGRISIQ